MPLTPKPFLLLLITLGAGFLHTNAQSAPDTIFYSAGWKETSRDSAAYFRTGTVFRDGHYLATDRYMNGTPQMEGSYKSLVPEIKDGPMIFYSATGKVLSKEFYADNMREGELLTFDTASGNMTGRYHFHRDKLEGKKEIFDVRSKALLESYTYRGDTLIDTVTWYYPSGKPRHRVFFTQAPLGDAYSYDTLGRIKAISKTDRAMKQQGRLQLIYTATGKVAQEGELHDGRLEGPYRKFDEECNMLISAGNYRHDQEDGIWTSYEPCTDKIINTISYKDGIQDGPSVQYDYVSSLITRKGENRAGLEEGEWTYYFPGTEKVFMKRNYRAGKLQGDLVTFYPSGQVRRKETYEDGVMTHWKCYATTGADTIYYQRTTPVDYPKDYQRFFTHQIDYPDEAATRHLSGKVQVRLDIDEHGRITWSEVIESTDPVFNREASRVARVLPIYAPLLEDGQPVGAYIYVVVDFKPND